MVAVSPEVREELLELAHQIAEEEWKEQQGNPLTPDTYEVLDLMRNLRLRPTDPTPQALDFAVALRKEVLRVIEEVCATRGVQGSDLFRETGNIAPPAFPSLTATPCPGENR